MKVTIRILDDKYYGGKYLHRKYLSTKYLTIKYLHVKLLETEYLDRTPLTIEYLDGKIAEKGWSMHQEHTVYTPPKPLRAKKFLVISCG